MPKPPHSHNSLKANDGFVAIVAIGIFALLAIFGIIIQQTVQDTYLSVKNTNNYYSARDIADSTTEYMLWTLMQYDVGYNTDNGNGGTVIHCEFADGIADPNNNILCDGLAGLVDTQEVVVDMEIKGRPLDSENLRTAACYTDPVLALEGLGDINSSCYVVPFPGTGDIGKRCNGYDPVFGAGSATVDSDLITGGNTLNEGFNEVDQVDYSCNWNKLSFGSSATDRVAIPLYYDDGTGTIVNPFNGGGATTFALRLRTPCMPCGESATAGGPQPQGTRECLSGQDPTVCIDDDRFELNVDNNPATNDDEIVVQWQLMGTCSDAAGDPQECSMVADSDPIFDSAIFESTINNSNEDVIIKNDTTGLLIHVHPQIDGRIITTDFNAEGQLPIYTQATLNLFLNEALISDNGLNIPYLEYQVFTDKPIANPKSRVEVTVSVDGNAFTKTLFRENQQTIIDFAIQN